MLSRLLPLAAVLFAAFTACNLDVSDEQPTATQSSQLPTAILENTTPPGASVATITPAPAATRPRPVGTPMGGTGLLDLTPAPTQLDADCLDQASGDATATAEARLAGPELDGTLELPDPYSPIPFVQDETLRQTLLDILGDEEDRYAFVVKDLATGRGAFHNPDRVFYAASLFKLFVMYEVFRQQSLGLLGWEDEYIISPYYDSFALSPRSTQLCQLLTVAEALTAMLSISDNAAAVLLQDLVGAGNINRAIEAFGVLDSGLFEDGLPLTAADTALLLEAIARGEAVSPAASADMLQLMSREGIDNGLEGGLPTEVVVAHKTGNWSNATHDAGIVYTAGNVYVFVVLSETDHETALIRALSAAAYEHFEAQPTPTPAP